MNTVRWSSLAFLCLAVIAPSIATAGELKVNDTAPDFQLPGTDGNTYRLSDLTAHQVVVLAWFPKAFTEG